MSSTHPGYGWLITPTHDWKQAPAPFAWVVYDPNGKRTAGYADTYEEAEQYIGWDVSTGRRSSWTANERHA